MFVNTPVPMTLINYRNWKNASVNKTLEPA